MWFLTQSWVHATGQVEFTGEDGPDANQNLSTRRGMSTLERAHPHREDGGHRAPPDPAPAGSGVDLEAENRELRKKAQRLEQENEIARRATAYFARDVFPQ